MSLDLTDDQSTMVQVIAWCRQATNHYLSQCWPRSLSPCGVIRPQWVKVRHFTRKWIWKYRLQSFNRNISADQEGWSRGHSRADSRFVPSQWETALLCNGVSHRLGANLKSALLKHSHPSIVRFVVYRFYVRRCRLVVRFTWKTGSWTHTFDLKIDCSQNIITGTFFAASSPCPDMDQLWNDIYYISTQID